jgi:TonB-linked SusC/RagA family outer membrane protein
VLANYPLCELAIQLNNLFKSKFMKTILIIFLWLVSVSVFAQTQNISGKITDSDGGALPGVTIVVKGTTTGTTSDIDGQFTMSNVSGDSELVFSFVGMLTQEVTVGNQSTVSIIMLPDAIGLDEIVAIGYGTIRKKDLTGSVSTIDAETAYETPSANLENALQGRAAGVQVTSSTGEPGSTPSIRIRGGNSITAGNEPLYVIDGYVGASNLTSINPNDIESMQVLKDASSTAIYGARGANGVILITTKKGKIGKPVVNFKASYGIQVLPEKVDVLSGSEFAEWVNDQSEDQDNLPFDLDNLPGEETDWQDVMFRAAPIQDYQLSLSGGSDKTKYYVSAGYLNQDGILVSSSFERYSLRSNIDTKISKVFSTGVNISLSETYSDNKSLGNFQNVLRADPLMPVYNEDGSYNGTVYGVSNAQTNILADSELNQDDTYRDRAMINAYLQASLFNKLTLKSTFGGDFLWSEHNEFIPSTNPTSIRTGMLGQADVTRFNDRQLLNENTIDYKQTFGDHSISALGGITFQTQSRETVIIDADDIPSDGVGVNSLELAGTTSINSNYSEYALFSVLGRFNYSYLSKYLFTATVRRDGSSRLGSNNKFATFPSLAMAWNMDEESFIKDVDMIDVLKIRASYGLTGNQGVDPFSTLATFTTSAIATILDGAAVAGVTQGTLENADLKWETTAQYDLGIEVGLFGGRLSAELDLYYKKTEDLLLDAEVLTQSGFETATSNVGSLQNKGIDFAINGVIISKKDFDWTASFNISKYKNEVLDLGNKTFITTVSLQGDPCAQLRVGQPVGTFYGYVFENVDSETGDAVYTDISGADGVPDGTIDSYDKTVIGDATPDFYGGFHTNMRYKNFDVSAFLPFSYGNDVYNTEAVWANEINVNSFAVLRRDMWSATNTENASYCSTSSSSMYKSTSFYVQDGSFLRLGTLQLGYTLPSGLLKGISNCRFYLTGTNLFLIKSSGYWGYDPDVSTYGDDAVKRGFDNYEYPQNRSFVAGVDITF